MRQISREELGIIVIKHELWLDGKDEGERANLNGADLSGCPLWGVNLSGANLRGANLRGANLCGVNLSKADLRGTDLSGCLLWGADLRGADLHNANLRSADLSRCSLWGADLQGADLTGADLSEVGLSGASLWGADLRGADLGDDKNLLGVGKHCEDIVMQNDCIDDVCKKLAGFLKEKNISYGGSAFKTYGAFSKLNPIDKINVRVDDKITRLVDGVEYRHEDTEKDLSGYLILKQAVRLYLEKRGEKGD